MQRSFSPGPRETAALVLVPLLYPVGLFFLWSSTAWNNRDKLLAALLPVGGYGALSFFYYTLPMQCATGTINGRAISGSCASSASVWSGPLGTVVVVSLLILPILNSLYLYMRLRQLSHAHRGREATGDRPLHAR